MAHTYADQTPENYANVHLAGSADSVVAPMESVRQSTRPVVQGPVSKAQTDGDCPQVAVRQASHWFHRAPTATPWAQFPKARIRSRLTRTWSSSSRRTMKRAVLAVSSSNLADLPAR
jgi:hypothetical protein